MYRISALSSVMCNARKCNSGVASHVLEDMHRGAGFFIQLGRAFFEAVMKRCLSLLFFLSSLLSAAQQIPAGTILPVALSASINSRKAKAGQPISARLMQPVDLGSGRQLRAGMRVQGSIVSVDANRVTLTFDRAIVDHQEVPIRTNLRALASMMAVQDAQVTTNIAGGDYGSSMQDWTTNPIGGGVLYNPYGGELYEGKTVIGRSRDGGVIAKPIAASACRGDLGSGQEQAFWVFSPSACGIYGMPVDLEHAGRTDPVGHITLEAKKPFIIRSGSGMLLRVAD
jgi:hypothetical protein